MCMKIPFARGENLCTIGSIIILFSCSNKTSQFYNDYSVSPLKMLEGWRISVCLLQRRGISSRSYFCLFFISLDIPEKARYNVNKKVLKWKTRFSNCFASVFISSLSSNSSQQHLVCFMKCEKKGVESTSSFKEVYVMIRLRLLNLVLQQSITPPILLHAIY